HAGCGDGNSHEHDRPPNEIQSGGDHGDPTEHGIGVGGDREMEGRTQPGVLPGLAGERHRRMLDREIAHVERLADRQKADDQEPVSLAGSRNEGLHLAATLPTQSGASKLRAWRWLAHRLCFAWTSGLALPAADGVNRTTTNRRSTPWNRFSRAARRAGRRPRVHHRMPPQTPWAGAGLGLYKSVKNAYLVRHGGLKANAH